MFVSVSVHRCSHVDFRRPAVTAGWRDRSAEKEKRVGGRRKCRLSSHGYWSWVALTIVFLWALLYNNVITARASCAVWSACYYSSTFCLCELKSLSQRGYLLLASIVLPWSWTAESYVMWARGVWFHFTNIFSSAVRLRCNMYAVLDGSDLKQMNVNSNNQTF